jgi:hypothetical protein
MDLKTQKITNPMYEMGIVAPLVHAFFKRIEKNPSVKGVSYESLITYFTSVVQYGGDMAEFHVVMDDDKPIAFAMWRVLGPPHFGMSYCEYIYSSTTSNEPMRLLCEAFVKYGEKHNTPFYSFVTVNEAVARRLKSISKQFGFDLEDTGLRNFIGRRT